MSDCPSPASPDLNSLFAALRAPFPANQISWRVGARTRDKKKGQALPYIDARDVQARLDEVCGPQNWKNSFVELREGVLCRLSIKCGEEWVTKEDVAGSDVVEATAGSDDVNQKRDIAVKGAHSDALKRAGVMWGIGRYLYAFDAPWVELRDEKYFVNQPSLPRHMLPEGDQSAGRPGSAATSTRAQDSQRQRPALSASSVSAATPTSAAPAAPSAAVTPTQPSAVSQSPAPAGATQPAAAGEAPHTPALIGTQEQWDALPVADRNTVSVLLERITKGIALHSITNYLTTGRGKELPQWLRTALTTRLDEKTRPAAQEQAASPAAAA